MNLNDFYTRNIFDAYNYLGTHIDSKGTMFRTFASNANRVILIGSFNNWQKTAL
ncbi:hypothetical protein [Cellulosilyticum ruminicola]|uniref:hypothetical protein n=1 Tax=Cellulosilyticum ruminicola TaxID=425254 RepID=UPI0009FB58F4